MLRDLCDINISHSFWIGVFKPFTFIPIQRPVRHWLTHTLSLTLSLSHTHTHALNHTSQQGADIVFDNVYFRYPSTRGSGAGYDGDGDEEEEERREGLENRYILNGTSFTIKAGGPRHSFLFLDDDHPYPTCALVDTYMHSLFYAFTMIIFSFMIFFEQKKREIMSKNYAKVEHFISCRKREYSLLCTAVCFIQKYYILNNIGS